MEDLSKKIKVYRSHYQDEINSSYLYELISHLEKNSKLFSVYSQMSQAEAKHARFWKEQLEEVGEKVGEGKPDLRTRILGWLAQKFGPQAVISILIGNEQQGNQGYQIDNNPESSKMAVEERSHARLLNHIVHQKSGGMEGGLLAQLEGRHRAGGGNALRAAVLGANDGLVSNLSLVMGVAGAALSTKSILITGLAGLLAGAGSMALGEWLSVQSSRELYKHQIEIEEDELESAPEEEESELALIYQAKGLAQDQAKLLAAKIMENKDTMIDTLAREELGIDPKELGGSAVEAAVTSFVLFAIGAIIPVVSFFFLSGIQAIILSVALSTLGLFIIGSVITLFTGRNIFYSGFRMVIFGLIAAALTFGIGKLIGGSISG
jgi:VIT1/CCC1 family predicted Fe2+/Mn2+ transporter